MRYGGISIRRVEDDSTCHVTVTGELDMSNVDELRIALDCSGKRVRLDTTELTFIDSTGLAALIEAREEVGPDRFELIPGPATSRILELTDLDRLFGTDSQPPAGSPVQPPTRTTDSER